MSYYPSLAYQMPSLEPPLRPPTALSGLLDAFISAFSSVPGVTDVATINAMTAAQKAMYCSTANPQTNCKAIAGVCLPMTSMALEAFKNLQRQANRMAAKEGRALIDVDGRIGPNTVQAVTAALKYSDTTWATIAGCDLVAAHAAEIAADIKARADQTNTPMVADPATSKPSTVGAGGTVVHPDKQTIITSADAGGLFNWIPAEVKTPLGLAALAVGGFAIYKAVKAPGGKRGGRGRARTRRARPRRRSR